MLMKSLILAAVIMLSAVLSFAATPLADLASRYTRQRPLVWGEHMPGIVSDFRPRGRELALTLDACGGGPRGDGYDARLIDWLKAQGIHATLFINARWAEHNASIFKKLVACPLFEIGNHGLEHRPCSVTPRRVYGIRATGSVAATIHEVVGAAAALERLGAPPLRFFRSGTAFYDDVAVRLIGDLGERVIGYTVAADRGATLPAAFVEHLVSSARPGSIVLCHMNRPDSGTRYGLIAALTSLKASGWKFVTLSQVLEAR